MSQDSGVLAVVEQELDRIAAMPGSPAKTTAIRQLSEGLPRLAARAAEIRKGEILRIRDEEQLSLAQLASRVGISKARADQIIKAERKEKEAVNG